MRDEVCSVLPDRKLAAQRVADGLRAVARDRPTHRMRRQPSITPKRSAQRLVKRKDRMCRDSGKERLRPRSRNRSCAKAMAEGNATSPKRAISKGCPVNKWTGRITSGASSSQCSANGPIRRATLCHPRPSAASAAPRSRSSITAVPSSSGCASGAGGWIHSKPWSRKGGKRKMASPRPSDARPSRSRAGSLAGSAPCCGPRPRLRLGLEYIDLQARLGKDDCRCQTVGPCADHSGSSWRRRHKGIV